MTARRFERVLDQWSGLGAAGTQELASVRLPTLLRAAGLSVWHPTSEARPEDGLLLGVASWSRLDLRLLDDLARSNAVLDPKLIIFDLHHLHEEGALLAAFPELAENPSQSPLLVEVRDGTVVDSSWGAAARERVCQRLSESAAPEPAAIEEVRPTPSSGTPVRVTVSARGSVLAVSAKRSRAANLVSAPRVGVVTIDGPSRATELRRRTPSVA